MKTIKIDNYQGYQVNFTVKLSAKPEGFFFNEFDKVVQNYIIKGEQFIILIREDGMQYLNALKIYLNYYNKKFIVKGDKIFYNNEIAGFILTLNNTRTKIFSEIHDCHNIKTIIFDNFICADCEKYLKYETDRFLDFYFNIYRQSKCECIFISSRIRNNPYFSTIDLIKG